MASKRKSCGLYHLATLGKQINAHASKERDSWPEEARDIVLNALLHGSQPRKHLGAQLLGSLSTQRPASGLQFGERVKQRALQPSSISIYIYICIYIYILSYIILYYNIYIYISNRGPIPQTKA